MDWLKWSQVLFPVLAAIARAVIEGGRAAGVTHETVALTVAKVVEHLGNGAMARSFQTPGPTDPSVFNPPT